MNFSAGFVVAGAALASLPAGWLVVLFVHRETGSATRTLWLPLLAANFAVAIWAALNIPPNYVLVATLLLGWALVALSAVDYLAFRLPDILTLPLIGSGLLLSFLLADHDPIGHVVGAAVGFVLLYAIAEAYRRFRNREGLGLGDAKLAAAAGGWLGWQPLPWVLLIACAIAFVWIGVGVSARGRSALAQQIPFGLPLCLALWLVWLYGAPDFSAIG
jgi:leader peptidase (prepilin peptidase)/N-methyltransferase